MTNHLDNNLCERCLKRVVLNRKNALFFKSEFGAYIGDMFTSLIHTCSLMKANPFDYLSEHLRERYMRRLNNSRVARISAG